MTELKYYYKLFNSQLLTNLNKTAKIQGFENIMALNQIQQIYEAIERSHQPLIVGRRAWEPDTIVSGLGFLKLMQRLEKNAHFVCEGFDAHENMKFLPHLEHIKPGVENLNKFIIKLDTSKIKLQDLSYDLKGDLLEIYLAPQTGVWSERDIKTQATDYKYDLIIAIDSPDLESLGRVYEDNADFFYKTPIINIDSNAANEHFGQINHVELTATSTSEIIYSIYENINRNFIDEDTATLLLAGMIAKTKSFKSGNVTPQTLATASQLVSLGARREQIIHNFYRTRNISTLKLWGRALARLKAEESLGLVWTIITRDDFIHSAAMPHDVEDVISELIINSPTASAILILYEHENQVNGILHTEKPLNAADLARYWQPEGESTRVRFSLAETNLVGAEENVTNHLKKELGKLAR